MNDMKPVLTGIEKMTMTTIRISCAAALTALLASCGGSFEGACFGTCAPDTETSEIRVVDGDTLDIDGQRWRLAGFDAPESRQTCRDADDAVWNCGQAATEALERLVSAGTVSCADSGDDRYGRSVGSCSAGGVDIGAALVREGLALDDPRYAPDYSAQEAEARERDLGIHAGRYVPPWEWRAGERLEDTMSAWLLSGTTDIDVHDLLPPEIIRGEIGRYVPALETEESEGADEAEGTEQTEETEDEMTSVAWGAWMDRSAFAVVDTGDAVLGVSWAPHFPATNPRETDGGAGWSGTMVGIDLEIGRDGGAVSGRAAITLDDFRDPAVDVSFTGIRTLESGTPVDAMEWRNLPVSRGAFSSDGRGHRIEGRFYGDRHREAGGVFEHGSIVGAFGASRD
ncbi:MAG: hypothetical protein F4128_10510 [Gammaproteobacteria bacterium]|nr:hypothetical protein [Gammaproteobacteria bacterium]